MRLHARSRQKVEIRLVWNLFGWLGIVLSRGLFKLLLVLILNGFNIRGYNMSSINQAFQMPGGPWLIMNSSHYF